jgi:hypothetical protein
MRAGCGLLVSIRSGWAALSRLLREVMRPDSVLNSCATHGTCPVKTCLRACRDVILARDPRTEVEPSFAGLELVAPGLVFVTEWSREEPAPVRERSGFYVGVARVP